MSQEYEHAKARAELLGMPIPSEGEWRESDECREQVVEEDENTLPENLEQSEESTKRIGGGLGELNSILSSTQRKINRFKTVCGSLGTLLKIKGRGSQPATPTHAPKGDNNSQDEAQMASRSENSTPISSKKNPAAQQHKNIDINEKMGSHLDKLDALINSAENAQYSMQHQTNQMRRIVNK